MASKPGPTTQDLATGQIVMPDTKNLRGYNKYQDKFTRPFPVLDHIKVRALKLQPPDGWKIHNVFHEKLLRANSEDQDPARQQLIRQRLPTPEA